MRPLRLTKQTWAVVADWAGEQDSGRQRLAAKFLQSLMDGSWVDDFDNDLAKSEVVTVFLAPRVPAYMTIHERDGVEYGSVFTFEHDRDAESFDTGETLGVDPEPVPGFDDEGRRPPPELDELHPEPNETQEEYERRLRRFRRSG